jgi:hypothetical protein
MRRVPFFIFVCLILSSAAYAQVFGTVRVNLRDEQDLAVPGASVVLKAEASTWTQSTTADAQGDAVFTAVPIGHYMITASLSGFADERQDIEVTSNAIVPIRLKLKLAGLAESVEVSATPETINPESSRTETLTHRLDIERQPDADRSGSLSMITNNVPGTYVMHDHLHARGGHGVTFEIDGVPVPNSNLAAVGSQFDPKDVDYLESERGGLAANYGDRAYGVFNVIPRSGFEGNKFGDATARYGNYHQGSLYSSVGNHTADQKMAWFASGSGSMTDRGLERVDIPVLHDKADSVSAFTSVLYNPSSTNQFRLVGSARQDHYQVPNIVEQQALGIRDEEKATDAFLNTTWVHTTASDLLVTISPYYHFNRGQYIGGASDPLVTNDNRGSHYAGGYVNVSQTRGRHTYHYGTDTFAEHDDSLFGLQSNVGSHLALTHEEVLWANVMSVFGEETFRATQNLTLNGGIRAERFAGTLTEHAVSPRLGMAWQVGRGAVLRASYGRFYQHPQTSTVSGPLLQFALQEGFGYLPVPGERDQMVEVGLGVPVKGWTLDFDGFYNKTKNLVDHEVLGNSNLLFPLTIDNGRVRAFESTLKSPLLAGVVRLHYAFSLQSAQGRGNTTGGLTNFKPPPNNAYFYLDHDQRVTFTPGAELTLPASAWASASVTYGSGFLLGNGPAHMPGHTTLDVAAGKGLGRDVELRFSALNVTNALFLTGFENSFAGTHYANPREITGQVKIKFHY